MTRTSPPPDEKVHHETLEEEATHITDECRMVLPGVQAILGFQLMAAFNERFDQFSRGEQVVHLVAFLLVMAAMGLIMAPAAYHRQVERGRVSRTFVNLSSRLLTLAMLPFLAGVCLDAYLVARLILGETRPSLLVAIGTLVILAGLWFFLPTMCRLRNHRD